MPSTPGQTCPLPPARHTCVVYDRQQKRTRHHPRIHNAQQARFPITASSFNRRPSLNAPLAVITGATGGIGEHTARLLAQRGMRTILIAPRKDRLTPLEGELAAIAPCSSIAMDLSRIEFIAPAMEKLQAEHGPVDVLINNAGQGEYKILLDHSLEECERQLRLNFTAHIQMIRCLLPAMLQRNAGHVINVASMSTKFGPWGHSMYAAAKSALVTATQSLAVEHQQSNVRFSYVNPGLVATRFFDQKEMQPLLEKVKGRMIRPEVVARKMIDLLDHPKLELCVPGHYRMLDLIRFLSPKLAMHMVAKESRPGQRVK